MMGPQRLQQQGGDIARRLGENRAASIRQNIADTAKDFGGIDAHVDGEMVVMEGRNLLERWLRDAELRTIGRRRR